MAGNDVSDISISSSNRYSGSFDPYDLNSYYFKKLNREQAEELLRIADVHVGTFLIRDSSSCIGDYSLSVRYGCVFLQTTNSVSDAFFCSETIDGQIRHYLIKRVEADNGDASYQVSAFERPFFSTVKVVFADR